MSAPKAKQRETGYGFLPSEHDQLTARALTRPALTECGLCPGWSYTGTVKDGQEAFREHALEAHPGRRTRSTKERREAARNAVPRHGTSNHRYEV